jgi:hypothetical protein
MTDDAPARTVAVRLLPADALADVDATVRSLVGKQVYDSPGSEEVTGKIVAADAREGWVIAYVELTAEWAVRVQVDPSIAGMRFLSTPSQPTLLQRTGESLELMMPAPPGGLGLQDLEALITAGTEWTVPGASFHDLRAARPSECAGCPFVESSRDVNPSDPGEGYYMCGLIHKRTGEPVEVWGESPRCEPEWWVEEALKELGRA